ncbi:MAG: peptide/nickel transport system substrate-binding protein [Chloroflexota bacterium]|nr:peptide/nickel transport system substrate-binding protein [Chloroflexota bacterium]
MRRVLKSACALCAIVALALAISACGGGGGGKDTGGGFGALPSKQDTSGKRGGTLTVLNASDVDSMDPAVTYYQFGFNVFFAIQRGLYGFEPDQQLEPSPDLADGPPQISSDGKTVTVKIKSGVKFSPPVNREVVSGDVKYAVERAFSKNIPAPYAGAYFGYIEGAPEAQAGPYKPISGIQTPDDQTIVFKLTKPYGAELAGAMVLPITAPVPKEYASKFDKSNPSTYGTHQVFTGPYQVENDKKGNLTGYEPKKLIKLVRNPNWDPKTDYRPAYLNEIDIREGNDDTVAAARRVLRGKGLVVGDFAVPPDVLREASQKFDGQVLLPPTGGNRYISLNTQVKPFDDINVRKAVIAGIDRDALRLTRGGPAIGEVATHFNAPGLPGFEEAGGVKGFPELDYLANPKGDPKVSAKYFKAAGMKSGKYEGPAISFAGDSDDPGNKTFLVAADQFRKLGFKLKTQTAKHEDLVTEVCGTPKQKIAVCVNTGWLKDFNDALTMFDLTFNGKNIKPTNNNNYPELNDPKVNAAIEKASAETDLKARAKAWAEVDRAVMEAAPIVPYVWDKQGNARSKDVKGVVNRFNATWDYSFTSIK